MSTEAITRYSRIALDIQAPVARIVLQNPPLNVIDIPMMEELAQALDAIESNPAITAITLSGSAKSFSVGVDVAAHTADRQVMQSISLSLASGMVDGSMPLVISVYWLMVPSLLYTRT